MRRRPAVAGSGWKSCGRYRRAATLWEFFMLLALLGIVVGLVGWSMTALIQTDRRIVTQGNRQAVVQAILHRLRSDMAMASRIEFEAVSGRPVAEEAPMEEQATTTSAPAGEIMEDLVVQVVRMEAGGRRIRYEVWERVNTVLEPNSSLMPAPAEQRLVRMDGDGSCVEWPMLGQTIAFETSPEAPDRLLRLAIESFAAYPTGQRRLRRFETTLFAGGLR